MAWKLENIRKDPNSKEMYADLFTSQIKEEPKTACLFTIGDARAVEIILEKYKNTQFVVFDYPALIKFLEFAKPANLFKAIPLRYDWESEDVFLKFVEELQNYNINNMPFDLIIANPPYERSLHARILQIIYNKCKTSKIVYLCPDSLLGGMSVNCVNARKCTEEALSGYNFLGPVDFGRAKPVVSLFTFDLHSAEKKTFESCRNSRRSEEEKSIRSKIDSTECWDPHKLSKTYNFTTTYSKWDESKNGNFRDWLKQKLDFSNPKRVFIGSTSALYYKQIAQTGEYPSYVAAFFQFETVEEASQFRKVIKDPFYSQILKIYSTNKRDLCPKQAKWPKSIEALNLTEKELDFINNL